jgi:hypothetical protein
MQHENKTRKTGWIEEATWFQHALTCKCAVHSWKARLRFLDSHLPCSCFYPVFLFQSTMFHVQTRSTACVYILNVQTYIYIHIRVSYVNVCVSISSLLSLPSFQPPSSTCRMPIITGSSRTSSKRLGVRMWFKVCSRPSRSLGEST